MCDIGEDILSATFSPPFLITVNGREMCILNVNNEKILKDINYDHLKKVAPCDEQ